MSHNKFHNSKKRRTRISHIMPYNQSSIGDKRGEKISTFFQRQLKNSHNHQSFSICHISSRDFKAFLPLISVCVPSGNSKSILWLSSSSLHLNNLFYLCKGIVHKLKLNKQTKKNIEIYSNRKKLQLEFLRRLIVPCFVSHSEPLIWTPTKPVRLFLQTRYMQKTTLALLYAINLIFMFAFYITICWTGCFTQITFSNSNSIRFFAFY